MLFSEKMNSKLNEQIGHEFAASMEYVSVATYFDGQSLPVLAKHFYRQAEEEREHAMRILHYVLEAGGKVTLPAVPAPTAEFRSAEEAVKASLKWEMTVTGQINALVALAKEESDYLSENFLQWFVAEQLEEVSSMETLLSVVRRAGEGGLFFVEEYLARQAEN